jgi:hypothetical protein
MLEDSIEFLDSQEINPAFYRELKAIVKKEPLFEGVYKEAIKAFCLNAFRKGLQAASEMDAFKGVISKAVCLSNRPEYELIKFRAKIPGKGNSESPRVCIATVRISNNIIPLTVYSHGDTKREPQIDVLLERMSNILRVQKRE